LYRFPITPLFNNKQWLKRWANVVNNYKLAISNLENMLSAIGKKQSAKG
jgi:hypothetical protein